MNIYDYTNHAGYRYDKASILQRVEEFADEIPSIKEKIIDRDSIEYIFSSLFVYTIDCEMFIVINSYITEVLAMAADNGFSIRDVTEDVMAYLLFEEILIEDGYKIIEE